MYELYQVGERSYYIQSPTKMGLIRLNDTDVCLIHSGNDKKAVFEDNRLLWKSL